MDSHLKKTHRRSVLPCLPLATALGLNVVIGSQDVLAAEPAAIETASMADRVNSTDAAGTTPRFWQHPDVYHWSIGARAAAGDARWGSSLAGILEIYARYQWVYGLGAQASYFRLGVGDADQSIGFTSNSFTLGPTWHPLRGFWFDPFIETHLVAFSGAYENYGGGNVRHKNGFGVEGVVGLQLATRCFAGGLHARYGNVSDHPTVPYADPRATWTMVGVQLEARL